MPNTFRLLDRGSPEWDAAWELLKAKYGDIVCLDERSGEHWQYMGTIEHPDKDEHQFRHRSLPPVNGGTYQRVNFSCFTASGKEAFEEEQTRLVIKFAVEERERAQKGD